MKYIILLAASLFQLCLGGIYAWSYFIPYLEEEFAVPPDKAQLIFGTCILVFTLCMIGGGRLQQRYGPRPVAMAGALCFGAAYIGAGWFATDFLGFLFYKGILEGIGIGLGYVCPLATALKWFPRRQGLATGFVVGGFGAGAIALSSIAHFLFGQGMTLSQVFIIMGIFYLATGTLAASFLILPPASKPLPESKPKATQATPSLWQLLSDRKFRLLCTGMFCGTFAGLLVIGSLNLIGIEGGISEAHAVLAISVFSIGNGSGRFFWGVLIDRFGRITFPASLTLLFLAVSVLLPMRNLHPNAFVITAGIVGFSFGACFVLYAAQTAFFFNPELVGSIYPLMFFLGYGIPGILGPVTGGFLHQLSGSYTVPVMAAASIALVGAAYSMRQLGLRETDGLESRNLITEKINE